MYSSFQEYTSESYLDKNGKVVTKKKGRAKVKENEEVKYYQLNDDGNYILSDENYYNGYEEYEPLIQSNSLTDLLHFPAYRPMRLISHQPRFYSPDEEIEYLKQENERLKKQLKQLK